MRRPVDRGRGERGFSLIEMLVGVTLLGIVMVPLSIATVVAWKTVFGIQQKLSSSADAQLLGATFPADVQSAGATGVNPTDPVNENTCAARAEDGETPLIMFVWDEDLGVSNQSVARYIAKGSGPESQIIRRFCQGTSSSEDVVVARNFGTPGLQQASLFTLGPDGKTSPQCTATSCFIKITGEYNFELSVDRRVPGTAPGAFTPDAPTNVHALGGNNRATVYWTEPADNGGPISGYLIEQTPGGAVLGPFAAPATTGTTGVQISGLTNGQSYTFRVLAQNVLGPGPYSAPSGPVTPGPSTPDPPTIGTATPHPTVNGQASIAWSIPSGYNDGGSALVGFKVYAQNGPDTPIVIPIDSPAATSSVVTGLSDNTRYEFQVSARNAYGEGSPSSSSLDALTLPGAPGTPTAAFTGTSGAVDVTFTPPTGGDFTTLTNLRAHIIESATYTTPVAAATACPGATPTTCTLTVTGIGSSQSYSIKVQAQNATGWGPESSAVTNVDLTAPVVTINTPGTYVNTGTPTIGGTAGTAAGDLPTITVKIYSGATATGSPVQTRTATAASGAWSLVASPALATGQYTAVATQTDSTGNTGTSNARTFTVDTVAPTGSITAPSANAWVRGAAVTVSSNSWDALSGVASAGFQYSPEGAGSWTTIASDTSSPYSVAWDTTYLTDDEYDLRVITTDQAGNTFTSPIRTVRADNTAPTIGTPNVAGTPGANGWYTGTVTVTWPTQPTDGYSGIASTTGCGTTSISTDQASQTVTCSATDNAGNTNSNAVTIKRDATQPSSATLSALGSYLKNGATLTGSGADATSGVASIAYLYCPGTSCVPSTTIGSSSAGGTYPVVWNSMPANGSYQVLARVFDNAGNSRDSTKQTITIDNTNPTGSIAPPAAGANLSGTVTVTASSADPGGSGVQSATIQRSPSGAGTWTTIVTDTLSPYTTSWNTASVTDGLYDLRVITQDNAGNTFTSPIVAVRVDNTDPTVGTANVAGTLGDNGWYTSDVAVTWPAPTDAGSGIASTPGCGTTNITTDTTGTTVTCTATDNAGNSASSSVVIKRDTVAPTKTAMDMRDNDGDGRIDRVVVTFNETLETYSAGTTPWTLANVPSGGTKSSATVSGSTATVVITEGGGALDTAVGSFTVALASSATGIRDDAGNRSSFAATAPTDDAAPVTTSARLDNKSGGQAGKAEAGDFVTITYSESLSVASLCTTWTGNTSNQSRTATVTLTNNGTSDYLTIGTPCTSIGEVDTNRDYVSTTRTFSSSTIAWTVSSETLKITLGTASGSTNSGISSIAPTYDPETGLEDPAGNNMLSNDFTGTSSRF